MLKQVLQSSIKWLLQMWPFILILAGGVKWYGKDQVAKQAVNDSISLVLKESRETKKAVTDYYQYKLNNNNRINILEGSYKSLDNSYLRTLEKRLKDKDELLQYKDEKIKALDEALKKNSFYDWIPSPKQNMTSNLNMNQ
jgi:DNA repair ATPase RecN